ncbi:hypothetical protein B0T25DRAFT_613804, partial [Lasiosphaeria hispida]
GKTPPRHGIRSLRFPRLQTLYLALGDYDPHNHSFMACKHENAEKEPSYQVDPLSDGLRIFTQSCPLLKELILSDGKFSSALFHPRTSTTPVWPELESLTIPMRGNLVAPNGRWYFTGSEPHQAAFTQQHNKGYKFANSDPPF